MAVKIADTDEALRSIAPVLLQLRPDFTEESLIAQIKRQALSGFQIAYLEAEGRPVCVAGFIPCEKLAWGKSLYIDDLVTDETYRSHGAGKRMLDWFKTFARENGYGQIHLDSRNIRLDAHRFYVREGFSKDGFHFTFKDF